MNDGRCDPAGRFWVGTMRDPPDPALKTGTLYRLGFDLACTSAAALCPTAWHSAPMAARSTTPIRTRQCARFGRGSSNSRRATLAIVEYSWIPAGCQADPTEVAAMRTDAIGQRASMVGKSCASRPSVNWIGVLNCQSQSQPCSLSEAASLTQYLLRPFDQTMSISPASR
jgi:hypothetical protein